MTIFFQIAKKKILHDRSPLQASSFFFFSMTVVTHLPLCLNPSTGKMQS